MIHIKRSILVVLMLFSIVMFSQYKVSGIVTNDNAIPLANVEIYSTLGGQLAKTNDRGFYEFTTQKNEINLVFFIEEYQLKEKKISLGKPLNTVNITLYPLSQQLNEVVLQQRKRKVFALKQLKEVEGTAIYAGKKSEVVLVNELVGNKASNTARQIYSQVVGLNIYENDDAGLQLNIGGRGLDPNRTSNFNTRQNGYDISADVLGYPESYYTPPVDALKEIQLVRGAASLQYGTQFGGLLNFKFKEPVKNKRFELITRQSVGSNYLFNSFNSVSGTVDKIGYYGYANYKRGDGFRPNSKFHAINIHAHLKHHFSEKTSLTLETTYLSYLAKQAGGLTDAKFKEDHLYSNRTRNWFDVNWNLWAAKFNHEFNDKSKVSVNLFGLEASRKALGFRGNYERPEQMNPVKDEDEKGEREGYKIRDLIIGKYRNWGVEARFLSNYTIKKQNQTYLLGLKYYEANNSEQQGPGSRGVDADFKYVSQELYSSSDFKFPNRNIAFFGEHIFKMTDNFSITPGFRLEYIKTESAGNYTRILRGGNGKPLIGGIKNYLDNRTKERNFALLGLGLSYKYNPSIEFYANASQNYRSVTFTDIRTVNPTFVVDENITDEKGATTDIGFRGEFNKIFKYDISVFGLFYNERIGVIVESKGKNKGDRVRTNVGDAFIYGLESFITADLANIFNINNTDYTFNYFNNLAITQSEYTKSEKDKAIVGRRVEFIPFLNLKTGFKIGYKNLLSNIQFTHLSKQYTDATNAEDSPEDKNPNNKGTVGIIPDYSILDISLSYLYENWKVETGVNNVLDEKYFTRRATGYPGPGIIPSAPRSWYVTLQYKL